MNSISILGLLIGCSKNSGQTDDTGLSERDQLPQLVINTPNRATFFETDKVEVQGTASSKSTAIKSLAINGIDIQIEASGGFSQNLPVSVGLNILSAHLENVAGKSAKDGRAFYWGPALYPGDIATESLRMRLGPELLDDDDPDMDDLATLVELAAADDSLAQTLEGTTLSEDNYEFVLRSLAIERADADISPENGFLSLAIDLHNFTMDFDINDIFGVGSFDTNGSAWADTVTMNLDIALAVSNGQVETTTNQAQTTMSGFALTVDTFPDSLEANLANWIQEYIQEAAADALQDQASNLLVDFIESMSADITVGDVDVFTTLNQVEIKKTGIRITADLASQGGDLSSLPKNAGSPKTPSDPPDWSELPNQPLALAIDDDLLNQFFFSYWATGAMSGFEFSGTEMALLSGGPIDTPLGPVANASLNFELPPMFRKSEQSDMTGDIGFGELRLAMTREDGLVQDFSINTWVGALATLTDSGKLDFELESRPEQIAMEIGILESDPTFDPNEISELIREMIPSLFDRASALAPSFEIPTIPLGETLEVDSLKDLELGLQNATIALNTDNWLLLGASVAASQQ